MKEFSFRGALNGPARRIVSLAPSLTEILFSLGLGESVCGVTAQCDYPADARGKETIGSFAAPDVAKIAEMRPDLVLSLGRIHARYRPALESAGIAVLDMEPASVEGILSTMEEIARLGGSERGASFVESLRARVRRCAKRAPEPRPRVFRLMSRDPLVTPSPSCYQSDAIRLAGGQIMRAASDSPWSSVTQEDVIRYDPQLIVSCGRDDGQEPRPRCPGCEAKIPTCQRLVSQIREWEGWKETTAARDGRVYGLPCGHFCRPGPRIVDGIEWLAGLLHDAPSAARST